MKKKVWLPTIIMFFFGVLFLMPIILLVMNAFKTHNDMIQNFLSFPHYLYTGNFTEAIERLKFWRVVGNSAYVTLGTMLVCTIISFMAAYGIAHIPVHVLHLSPVFSISHIDQSTFAMSYFSSHCARN